MPDGRIAVPGGRVWYRVVGEADGTPLLVLHGGPGSPHDYLEALSGLADERPVVFYDQLGCGRSDRPSDASLWTLGRALDELRTLRAALGLERAHVIGHSWGSMLAVDDALARPDATAALVLSSPCLSMTRVIADMEQHKRALPPAVQRVIARHETAGTCDSGEYRTAVMAFYQRHVCRLPQWPEALQRCYDGWGHEVYRTMWGPSEFHVTGNLRSYERTDRLGELRMPTLFVVGRHDEITPEAAGAYAAGIRGAELTVFEQSAHLQTIEEPARAVAVLRDFLRRVESRASA
jgi:proline iminopeptidase